MAPCLSDAFARFLDHCRISKRLSANTLRAYEADLQDFAVHAGADRLVVAVDREVLRAYARHLFDERCLKESTVKRRMASLKVMFRWLELDEVIDLSPFHRLDFTVRLPRRLPRALTVEEMRRLLDAAEEDADAAKGGIRYGAVLLHFVVVCLFATGLRVGELADVRVDDVDLAGASILVRGKGNRERRVYLPSRHAKEVLASYLNDRTKRRSECNNLLISDTGKPVTSQAIRRALVALAQRAGISRRVTPHMLRHTAATQLVEAGVDIRFVQKLLGHASIATTQIYTQVSDTSLRATLERADTLAKVRLRVG